jgi:hypothetical protein
MSTRYRVNNRWSARLSRSKASMRKAQVLASLNHPNIAAIHGFEQSPEGLQALVLELVKTIGRMKGLFVNGMPLIRLTECSLYGPSSRQHSADCY